jgi:hypothetical protein
MSRFHRSNSRPCGGCKIASLFTAASTEARLRAICSVDVPSTSLATLAYLFDRLSKRIGYCVLDVHNLIKHALSILQSSSTLRPSLFIVDVASGDRDRWILNAAISNKAFKPRVRTAFGREVMLVLSSRSRRCARRAFGTQCLKVIFLQPLDILHKYTL